MTTLSGAGAAASGGAAMTGGAAVLRTIRAYGVDTIFGIPGTHNLELYRPLPELGFRAVTTRHEQGAGYAADGWAQRSGLPGVVITTSGPGLLNVLSAAATAFCESRPLLVLSPGVPSGQSYADRGDLHETKDPTGAAGSVMLWSRRVSSVEEAVESIHEAFALFRAGRPRPVHVEIPMDVLAATVDLDERLLAPRAVARREPDPATIAAAAALLARAERPVIIAGGGSLGATGALTALAEHLQAPVITTLNGKGAIPESHPLSLASELRLAATVEVARTADVLLVLGAKLGEAELWGHELVGQQCVIRVDIDSGRLQTNIAAEVAVAADTRAVVEALLMALPGQPGAAGRVAPDLSPVRECQSAEAHAFSPAIMAAAEEIVSAVPAHATIAGDSSQITYYGVTSAWRQDDPHRLLYMPAYATLGYGLPAAIGAAIADPSRPAVAIVGDGALMFSVQELMTAVEQGIDLTVVCVDNGGYREIRENEADLGIAPIGVDLHQPDWALLARAFGGNGHRVDDRSAVADTIARAIAEPGVSLVHIPFSVYTVAEEAP